MNQGTSVQESRKAFLKEFGGPQKWGNYKDVVWSVIMMAAENVLTWREQEIIRGILSLRSFEELSVEFTVSPERVRQIFRRALRRVTSFRHLITDEMATAKDEIKRLKDDNARLKNEVFRLQHPDMTDLPDDVSAIFRLTWPYTEAVDDCNFSVRLCNCLRSNGIHTVGDIVSFKRTEYMRIRNLGKKTLAELDDFLYSLKLTYDMWTNPDRPKM